MGIVFELGRESAVINFTAQYCQSTVELLDSIGFEKVLAAYLRTIEKQDLSYYGYLEMVVSENGKFGDTSTLVADLRQLFKLLLVLSPEEIETNFANYAVYFIDKELLLALIEGFYNYWRRLGRYAVAYNVQQQNGIQNSQFIEMHDRFEALVLATYRTITEHIMGQQNRVYRQLIAGVNAGITVSPVKNLLTDDTYAELTAIPMIESVILHPPFITYPKKNTRKGVFTEIFENPLIDKKFAKDDYFCYPAKVGDLLAFVYFHKDFMDQGITLCNLFELADMEEVKQRKPDLIYTYGVPDEEEKTVFYKDEINDIYVGYISYSESFDYFGYMKKMILTLHNVKVLDKQALPIHGAMANIIMANGNIKNIIIMGDSGAGKSETLEALRSVGEQYIKEIKIIFDDMGVISDYDEHEFPVAHGTEIGAFVRLDDLENGYAYKEIDRSIFMNPDKINARIVIPVATYEEITHRYPIDLFLYANNYEDDAPFSFFDTVDEAIMVFKKGARMAKGTTSEVGLVESYFANPFGPVQRPEQTEVLIKKFFYAMAEHGAKLGQIRTKLGLVGNEQDGPKEAALALLEYLLDNE